MNYRKLIAADKELVTYRPALRKIGGSVAGTVLLQQIIYWDEKSGGKFYKFSEPCKHDLYKDGDSWEEELGMSAKELRTALNQFAFKCGSKNKSKFKDEYDDKRRSSVVQYYTDSHRVTWYLLNREVLSKLLLGIYKENPDAGVTIITESTTENTTDNISSSAKASDSCVQSPPKAKEKKQSVAQQHQYSPTFEVVWAVYPKKKSKGAAAKAFDKALKLTDVDTILGAIRHQKEWPDWKKDGGKYIPHFATWLNGRNWDDEPDGQPASSGPEFDDSYYC